MAILLDTQVVLWWLADDERLGPRAITALDAERDPVAVSSTCRRGGGAAPHHRDRSIASSWPRPRPKGRSLMTADAALATYDVPLIDPRR